MRLAEACAAGSTDGLDEKADDEIEMETYTYVVGGQSERLRDDPASAFDPLDRVKGPSAADAALMAHMPSAEWRSRIDIEKTLLDLRTASLPACEDVLVRMSRAVSVVAQRSSRSGESDDDISLDAIFNAWHAYVEEYELLERSVRLLRTHPSITEVDKVRAVHTLCVVRPYESAVSVRGDY